MISEWKADFIEQKVAEGHELHTVTVTLDNYRARYTAVRQALARTHPHLVITQYSGFPCFLNERKNPHKENEYEITVLAHHRVKWTAEARTRLPTIL